MGQGIMRIKCKTIKSGGNSFIKRMSVYFKDFSIKIHLILDDDKDEPHTHPWDFKSFLIIPYKETLFYRDDSGEIGVIHHKPFKVIKRSHKIRHKVKLYRILGIKIPALTIGRYTEKKQLCSFCQSLGYCKENGKS